MERLLDENFQTVMIAVYVLLTVYFVWLIYLMLKPSDDDEEMKAMLNGRLKEYYEAKHREGRS
jgi:hypothetical protein